MEKAFSSKQIRLRTQRNLEKSKILRKEETWMVDKHKMTLDLVSNSGNVNRVMLIYFLIVPGLANNTGYWRKCRSGQNLISSW